MHPKANESDILNECGEKNQYLKQENANNLSSS